MPDSRIIVRLHPLAVIAADADGYSLGSSALKPTVSLSGRLWTIEFLAHDK
jgi:hypothetical protein